MKKKGKKKEVFPKTPEENIKDHYRREGIRLKAMRTEAERTLAFVDTCLKLGSSDESMKNLLELKLTCKTLLGELQENIKRHNQVVKQNYPDLPLIDELYTVKVKK